MATVQSPERRRGKVDQVERFDAAAEIANSAVPCGEFPVLVRTPDNCASSNATHILLWQAVIDNQQLVLYMRELRCKQGLHLFHSICIPLLTVASEQRDYSHRSATSETCESQRLVPLEPAARIRADRATRQ